MSRPSGMKSKFEITPPIHLGDGRKRFMINEQSFEVDDRYNLTKVLGFGAYGFVCAAVDTSIGTHTRVAIKKCNNVFRDLGDCKRVLREVKLLKFLRHENLLQIRHLLRPRESPTALSFHMNVMPIVEDILVKSQNPGHRNQGTIEGSVWGI